MLNVVEGNKNSAAILKTSLLFLNWSVIYLVSYVETLSLHMYPRELTDMLTK